MRVHGHRIGTVLELEHRLGESGPDLRWGGQFVPGAINGEANLLDGLQQLQTMNAAGIKVPLFTVGLTTNRHMVGTWLARKAHHTQGRDIIPVGQRIRGRRRWEDSDFFVQYVPDVVREWRFHILRGESIARALKVWSGDGPEPTTHPIIRSRRLGWHMRHDVDPPKAIRKAAKAACEAVGYDLGAVDVLELTTGEACVLEVNSRPALRDEYTLGQYVKAFRALAMRVEA